MVKCATIIYGVMPAMLPLANDRVITDRAPLICVDMHYEYLVAISFLTFFFICEIFSPRRQMIKSCWEAVGFIADSMAGAQLLY